MVFNSIIIFCVGLIFGSFMNVLIFRLGKKKGIINGRSECQTCLTRLKWYDLFPLFSYFYLKGKCRYCRTRISAVYPLVEGLMGLSFVIMFLTRWPAIDLIWFIELTFVFFFVLILIYDYLFYIIPDIIVGPLILLQIIYILFTDGPLFSLLLTGVLLASFFATIYLVSKGKWMGLGDAKLVFLLGIIFGYPLGFLVVVLSVWLAAIFGIILLILKKANLKTAIPFGTFLASISILMILFKYEIESKFEFIYWFF